MTFESIVLAHLNLPERDEPFREALYAAMCNQGWTDGVESFTCSWRTAGGLVAEYSHSGGDYLDYYCGGNEGIVTDEVAQAIKPYGWFSCEWEIAAAIEHPNAAPRYLGQLQFQQWATQQKLPAYSMRSNHDNVTFNVFSNEDEYVLNTTTGAVMFGGQEILPAIDIRQWLPVRNPS